MGTHIEYLVDYPQHIPVLAQWHCRQWSYLSPGDSVERRVAGLQSHLQRLSIPTTFIALSCDVLVGSASLIAHDMDTRMHLTPWLASVYVAPDSRRQGTGSALVQRVVDEARALGVPTLYLFTPDRERFYAHMGWVTIERTAYRGYAQVVMSLELVD